MQKIISVLLLPFCFLICLLSCAPSPSKDIIATDSVSVAGGRELFQANCSSCHNFKQDGIGPDLSGITETDSLIWLKEFIRDPKNLVGSGDAQAKKLLDRYHVLMPSFTALTETQINQLLSYLHAQKAHKKKIEDPLAIKDPVPQKIAASDLVAGLELFSEMPATSDKEPRTRISKMDWTP